MNPLYFDHHSSQYQTIRTDLVLIAYDYSSLDVAEYISVDNDVSIQFEERDAQAATKKEPKKTQYDRIWTPANGKLVAG